VRTKLTVNSVGELEKLSGGAPKLQFTASKNGDGVEVGCYTFKPTVIEEVIPGNVIDVDLEEMHYSTKNGDLVLYKITWIHKPEDEQVKPNGQPAQSGTWREEKAAEVIGQLLVGKVITSKHKLAKKLFAWLDETLPE